MVECPDEPMFGPDTGNITAVPLRGNRVDRFEWDGSVLRFDHNLIKLRSFQLDAGQTPRGNHNGGIIAFGPDARNVQTPYAFDSFLVGRLIVDASKAYAGATAVLIAASLFAFFRFTILGKAIRACADNYAGALVVGKLAAAALTARVFGYPAAEAKLSFSLTLPQMAATLASAVVGYETRNAAGERLLDAGFVNASLVLVVATCVAASCGDGVRHAEAEVCDGEDLGDADCASEGFVGGTLACTERCELDTTACCEILPCP